MFIDLRGIFSTPALINSAEIWSVAGDLWLFKFSVAISGHSAETLVVLLYVYLYA